MDNFTTNIDDNQSLGDTCMQKLRADSLNDRRAPRPAAALLPALATLVAATVPLIRGVNDVVHIRLGFLELRLRLEVLGGGDVTAHHRGRGISNQHDAAALAMKRTQRPCTAIMRQTDVRRGPETDVV